MTLKTNKVDEANSTITATIDAKAVQVILDKLAKDAAKNMDVQGFRKGKVPVTVVKQRYAEKLTQDAQSEALRDVLDAGLKELDIDNKKLIGEPAITKFEVKGDSNIETEIQIYSRPDFSLGNYKELVPAMTAPYVDAKEVEEELEKMTSQGAPLSKIKRKRAAKSGDYALIDFEGFKDGVAFDGGKAEGHILEIGSNSFIPGFEDQVIGMKYEEEKEIEVTFPEEYQSKDLAGAEVLFKVKLHEIQEKVSAELNDEFAQKMLPGEKDVTVETLKTKLEEQILSQKKNAYFAEEVKSTYMDALVKNIKFAVPTSILDQEINQALNAKVKDMSEEEVKALQDNPAEVKKMQDELSPDATNSVKATFIIDSLAKEEGISVTDEEVTQTIYYEAMMGGQDGQAVIKQYEEAGYLPMIKMSMIESKVMNKILDEALTAKKAK